MPVCVCPCVALLCLAPLTGRNSPEGCASSQQRLENTFLQCSTNLSEIKNAFLLREHWQTHIHVSEWCCATVYRAGCKWDFALWGMNYLYHREETACCVFHQPVSLSFSQAITLVQTEISMATSRWIAVPFCKVIHGP